MQMPKYQELTLPFLKILKEENALLNTAELKKRLALLLNLKDEVLEENLPSGKNKFADRVDWAKSVLKEAGLIQSPIHGSYILSTKGKGLELDKIAIIDSKFLKALKENSEDLAPFTTMLSVQESEQTPEEIMENAYSKLKQHIKTDLLEKIKSNNPAFFERLVVDLLVAMGYGGSHQDAAQAIGKTNDGGIDGIISEDRLGLDKIYIQAKRWENTIGRPDIQQFKGALADQVAKKGVFITTSSFSKEAIESAKKSGIVLIDGDRLTSLMIEFGLGVTIERSFHVYRIDSDRFEESI